MDPKEVKQLLKEAKEGLKKNDCMGAAKACKTILRKEPENYQANLLLGTACREQSKYQQALEAYKKAAQIDGKQVYAWQGIISVYERQNIKAHNDLLDAYKRVATHFEIDDKQKYIDNTMKLANILISQQDGAKALKVMARLAKSVGLNLEIAQVLVTLLKETRSDARSTEDDMLYTNALEVVVSEAPQPAEETYQKLFSQLYRNQLYAKLAAKCMGVQDQWNFYFSPMEFLCRLYLESQVDAALLQQHCGGILKITDRLFKLHPTSRYGYFARGKYLIEELFKYAEGFTWINNALESSYNLNAALILVRGKLKFGDYEGGLEEAAKGIANCSGDKNRNKEDFKTQFELLYLEGLIGTNEGDRAEQQRLKLAEEFKDSPDHSLLVSFLDLSVQTALKQKDLSELTTLVSSSESATSLNGLPLWRLDFYKAVRDAVKSGEKFDTYIRSLVLTHNQLPELLMLAGIFLYDHGEFDATAEILTTLAGTEKGRNHPHTWKYLGLLANLDGDSEKAARFLKKSYDLNLDSDVGALLSDIYHDMGELEQKKNHLIDATKKVRKTKSKWVWSRLGLLHLEEGNYLEAVESLQCAIRVDLDDGFLWESLADAYFYRGSLQAALRCYNKAIEHGVDQIYPKMRISSIYQSMEEEDKSISGLKQLIEENPTNSPLHLELAEVYCWVAREKVRENFDIGAVSSVEDGLVSAVKAILHADTTMDMTLPWLIIGDYSITLGDLPDATSLSVPAFLAQTQTEANRTIEEKLNVVSLSLQRFKQIGTKALLQCLQMLTSSSSDKEMNKIQQSVELLGYLYHQIALSYYKRAIAITDQEQRKDLLLFAVQNGKKAIAKCRSSSLYWNTVGLVSFYLSDIPFAQNCFIRALQTDGNNVVAWANLGMLYFQEGEFIRAHKAFAKGQCVAPIYANSWIGQGICAEVLKPAEAPDLFRHACLLRHHPFAITSYGNAICRFLLEDNEKEQSEEQRYWSWHLLVRMDAVTHLYDLISRIEGRHASPQLYNLKGIMSGWNGFYQTSLESFNTALKLSSSGGGAAAAGEEYKLSEGKQLTVQSNKVSSMVSLKMFAEAKDELMTFPTLDGAGLANAALALYKLGDIPNAIGMYKKILQLPEAESKKSDVKIALALLVNMLEGVDAAKSILFAKDKIKNPRALLSLGAMAVSHNDTKLLAAVSQELRLFQCSPQLAPDICFLRVCKEILQSSPQSAVKVVLHFIHMHPTNPRLYALACQVIIMYCLGKYSVSIPRHLALCTLKISRIVGQSREDGLFASKHSGIVSLTHLIECDDKTAIRATLKAIRCYPEQRDNWAVLACGYWVQYSKLKSPKLFLNVINILDREISLGLCSARINQWMSSFRVEIAKYGRSV